MAEPTAPTKAGTDQELVRLREENLRLRDQLIARDAEIGLMRGQVAELEAGAVRALHMLRRVKSILMPGIVLKVLRRVRRLAKRG
jgi:tetrahydromethanopterin S-methyltransferase subunit F